MADGHRNNSRSISKLLTPTLIIFFGHRPIFFEMTEKNLSHLGHDVRKYRLVNPVTACFNTIMGQMTEMSQ